MNSWIILLLIIGAVGMACRLYFMFSADPRLPTEDEAAWERNNADGY